MSRSGNRVTPASGRAGATAPGRSTGTRSGVLPGVRWWPRARPRPGSGTPEEETGRWGVARLVAQREAERRAEQEPAGDSEAAVPDARISEDGSADAAGDRASAADDRTAGAQADDVDHAVTQAPDPHPGSVVDTGPAAGARADGAVTGGAVAGGAAADGAAADRVAGNGAAADRPAGDGAAAGAVREGPEDVPPPRRPVPPGPAVPPSPRPPLRTPRPVPRPPLPVPRRPPGVRFGPVVPNASDGRASRPRVEPDPALFGFARHTRGRIGSLLFRLFFLLVFALILVQTVASIV